jgi:hypothetical protein
MLLIIEPEEIKDYNYRLMGCTEPELCECYEPGCGGKELCMEDSGCGPYCGPEQGCGLELTCYVHGCEPSHGGSCPTACEEVCDLEF